MATKRSKSKDTPVTTDSTPLRNSAFAGLAGLRETLPAGDAVPHAPEPAEPTPPGNDATQAPADKVVLQREKKGRSGKTVTRLRGLATTSADAKRWAKQLKRQLGCGATIEDNDVVLLGDLLDRAAEVLQAAGVRRVVRGN